MPGQYSAGFVAGIAANDICPLPALEQLFRCQFRRFFGALRRCESNISNISNIIFPIVFFGHFYRFFGYFHHFYGYFCLYKLLDKSNINDITLGFYLWELR